MKMVDIKWEGEKQGCFVPLQTQANLSQDTFKLGKLHSMQMYYNFKKTMNDNTAAYWDVRATLCKLACQRAKPLNLFIVLTAKELQSEVPTKLLVQAEWKCKWLRSRTKRAVGWGILDELMKIAKHPDCIVHTLNSGEKLTNKSLQSSELYQIHQIRANSLTTSLAQIKPMRTSNCNNHLKSVMKTCGITRWVVSQGYSRANSSVPTFSPCGLFRPSYPQIPHGKCLCTLPCASMYFTNSNIPGNLFMSKLSCLFSSYDIGLPMSSSSLSSAGGFLALEVDLFALKVQK